MQKTIPIYSAARPSAPTRRGVLARLGDWMVRHRRLILGIQWSIVIFYALLVVLPAFLPQPSPDARLFSADWGSSTYVDANQCATPESASAPSMPLLDKPVAPTLWHERLVLLAQYLFWGVWWPFVILSIMFMGRVWCGVLCPEGALAEWAGKKRKHGWVIPRWMRWGGWPFVAFLLTTVYGQLISVYEYPQAALLILGGSTLAAMAIGWMYGRGKRVWCRYLCPVSGVFALLARLAPWHVRIDRSAWQAYEGRSAAIDCPPLLNVGHLNSMAGCHACGRCSGHRDAVQFSPRSPNAEILSGSLPGRYEVALLLFGILGVALGAFQWTVSPWFVQGKQWLAEWLVEHDVQALFYDDLPWWVLTHQPAANDVFSLLDGVSILAYLSLVALGVGGALWAIARLAGGLARCHWRVLALALVPIAGFGLFLGLSMMTVTHLRAEGIVVPHLAELRELILAAGGLWSAYLGGRILFRHGQASLPRKVLACLIWLAAPLLPVYSWILVFFVW